MKPDDDHTFDQLIDYTARMARIVIALLAVVAVIALIIAAVSAWRYVADCTATSAHFGTLDCARAWAGWTD